MSALEADAVALGVETHVDHLREVKRDRGVLGLELVPAVRPAQRLVQPVVLLLGHAQAQHRAGLEADVDAPEPVLGHQCAGSTISVSTPPVDFGCRNATRLLRMPTRGCSSISRRPASRTRPSAESMSSVAYATWCRPGPFFAMNLPTPDSGESGRISSTCPSPTSSRTASTPCSSTVSRCCSRMSKEPE